MFPVNLDPMFLSVSNFLSSDLKSPSLLVTRSLVSFIFDDSTSLSLLHFLSDNPKCLSFFYPMILHFPRFFFDDPVSSFFDGQILSFPSFFITFKNGCKDLILQWWDSKRLMSKCPIQIKIFSCMNFALLYSTRMTQLCDWSMKLDFSTKTGNMLSIEDNISWNQVFRYISTHYDRWYTQYSIKYLILPSQTQYRHRQFLGI